MQKIKNKAEPKKFYIYLIKSLYAYINSIEYIKHF